MARENKQSQATIDAVITEKLHQDKKNTKHQVEYGEVDEKIKKRSQFQFRIMAALLALSFFIVALLIYWAVYPVNVLDIKSPVPVQNKIVKQGEILFLITDYCKITDSPGEISRFLVSDFTEVRLPLQMEEQEAGCREDQLVPNFIPPKLPAGEYHIRYRVLYKVNPVKSVEEVFATQKFEVVAR